MEEQAYKTIMSNVAVQLMNTIEMGVAYSANWSEQLSYSEVMSKYENIKSQLRDLISNITDLSGEELYILGFRRWDESMENLFLIPLWAWDMIPDGTELVSINGETVIKNGDEGIDLDVRFGCIPYGIEVY